MMARGMILLLTKNPVKVTMTSLNILMFSTGIFGLNVVKQRLIPRIIAWFPLTVHITPHLKGEPVAPIPLWKAVQRMIPELNCPLLLRTEWYRTKWFGF